MQGERLSVSEARLAEILDLRFAQFEQRVAEHFVTPERAREIVRDEFGIATRQRWDFRSKLAAVGMFIFSISTFVYTALHSWGDGGPHH